MRALLRDDVANSVVDTHSMDLPLLHDVIALRPVLQGAESQKAAIVFGDIPILLSPSVVSLHIRHVLLRLRRELDPEVPHILLVEMREFAGDVTETPPNPHPRLLIRGPLWREAINQVLDEFYLDI